MPTFVAFKSSQKGSAWQVIPTAAVILTNQIKNIENIQQMLSKILSKNL